MGYRRVARDTRVRYANCVWSFVCACSALGLAVVLVLYDPDDSCLLRYSVTAGPVHNVGGFFGASVAAVVLYMFGCASFVLVWFLAALARMLLVQRALLYELDRLVAFGVFTCAAAALCTHTGVAYRGASGGLVGYLAYAFVASLCDEKISAVIFGATCLSSWILLARKMLVKILRVALAAGRWCYDNEVPARVAKGVRHVVFVVSRPFVWLAVRTFKALSGATISESGISIVDFERAAQSDTDVYTITSDEFWRHYLARLSETCTVNACQEREAATTAGKNTEQGAAVTPAVISTDRGASHVSNYILPSSALFTRHVTASCDAPATTLRPDEEKARVLETKLAYFGLEGKVVAVKRGPRVTLFEYQPSIGSRINKIIALEDDLALAMEALSIRIVAPIAGTSVIGFEVANSAPESVSFVDVVGSREFTHHVGELDLALGVDTVGVPVIADLARMPHLLVAGSTGSGKSVVLHSMIVSLLFKHDPDDLKLVLIDPKRLEFSSYEGIAHLLAPVITQSTHAVLALTRVIEHMEERYELMNAAGVRTIADYRARFLSGAFKGTPMPFIVVVIDELADLMMTGGRDIEGLITRIAQMARAAGIHMIVATQRPSVDIITGPIKANFSSRLSCRVVSKVDSRVVLDVVGAEKLLGRGDMLLLDASNPVLRRVHGAYVSDGDIKAVADHIRRQRQPVYERLDVCPKVTPSTKSLEETRS